MFQAAIKNYVAWALDFVYLYLIANCNVLFRLTHVKCFFNATYD